MRKKVCFALIGCGRISAAHLNGIQKAASAELIAVCDIVEEKAKAMAEEAGLSAYYTDAEEMLLCEKPDAVCVLVPSGLHAEMAALAAKHGVHVLSEKPLDITKEKMDMAIAACKNAGVLLGGIFQRRNVSAVQIAKKAVEDGRLGKLVMASASLKYFREQAYYDSDAWRGTVALDRGCLMNQCIHGIDMLQYIAGRVESVSAMCATLARRMEAEDTAVSTVRFANGALGVIEAATTVTPGQDTVISIHGTRGTIVIGGDGFIKWELDDGSAMPETADSMGGMNCGWAGDDLHAVQIEDMATAILENRKPMVPGEEAREAVDIILAMYQSAESGGIAVKVHA